MIDLLREHTDLFIEGCSQGFILYRIGGKAYAEEVDRLLTTAEAFHAVLQANAERVAQLA